MNRRYDFDWLRALGAVLVVVAHCTILFSPWTPSLGQIQKSRLFSELGWYLNLWLMPLFMVLAGSSAWYALRRRSYGQYLRERLVHLSLPLLVLTVTYCVPAAYAVETWSGAYRGSLPDFYLHFFDGHFALFHLWFLAYLLAYSLLTLPLFWLLESAAGRRLTGALAHACQHTGGLYLFALPLLAVQLALYGIAPQTSSLVISNDWTRFSTLLVVFVFGYVLMSDERFQAAIAGQWKLALSLALATWAVLFAIAWPDGFDPYRDLPMDYSWRYMAFWSLFVFSSWSWLLAWLGFGQRILNVDHRLRIRAATASFPLYLLHPMLLPGAGLIVAQWPLNAFAGAAVMTTTVLAGGLALTAAAGRWPIARLLLGAKTEPASRPTFSQQQFELGPAAGQAKRDEAIEERVFGVLLALLALHLADAAVAGQGFGPIAYPLVPLAATVALPALFVAFVWRGRIVHTILAAGLGLVAVFYGSAANVAHLLITGAGGSDYTGLVFTLAGVVLLGLAFRIGFRGWRRPIQALAGLVMLFAVVNWVIGPAIQAGMATNAPRSASPSASALGILGATDVTFPARDGVRLVGWYVPGQNGAAVILLHGSHVTRASTVEHLRMLSQAGYAVLAYDGRGHGQSDGPMQTRAWYDDGDVAGAISFLGGQPGIDPERIAALGLSSGAMAALRAAANGVPLSAIIADGAAATTYEDLALVDGQLLEAPLALSGDWLSMRAIELLSGLKEPPSLVNIVGQIRVPVLLIASANPGELTEDQAYRAAIGPTATLWSVPDAGHIEALNTHPQDYAARVTAFLRAALAPHR